jgi:hypothetical protein
MAETKYWLPKFDPDAAFVVAAWPQGFTVSGYQPKPGEPFDKTSVSPRMLEEHYVKRWIAVAETSHVTPLPPQPPLSDPHLNQPHLSKKQLKKLRRAAA